MLLLVNALNGETAFAAAGVSHVALSGADTLAQYVDKNRIIARIATWPADFGLAGVTRRRT